MRDVKFMSIVKMTKCFSIIGHYVYNISLMAYLNVTEKKKKEGENETHSSPPKIETFPHELRS